MFWTEVLMGLEGYMSHGYGVEMWGGSVLCEHHQEDMKSVLSVIRHPLPLNHTGPSMPQWTSSEMVPGYVLLGRLHAETPGWGPKEAQAEAAWRRPS